MQHLLRRFPEGTKVTIKLPGQETVPRDRNQSERAWGRERTGHGEQSEPGTWVTLEHHFPGLPNERLR